LTWSLEKVVVFPKIKLLLKNLSLIFSGQRNYFIGHFFNMTENDYGMHEVITKAAFQSIELQ